MKRTTALVLAAVAAGCTPEHQGPVVDTICILGSGAAVYFDPGSATLTERSRSAIDDFITDYNQRVRDCGGPRDVWVAGHTDSTGSEAANEALSSQRAKIVADMLVEGGIPRERLEFVAGFGSRQPLIVLPPNPTEAERAHARGQDRRVDIGSR